MPFFINMCDIAHVGERNRTHISWGPNLSPYKVPAKMAGPNLSPYKVRVPMRVRI